MSPGTGERIKRGSPDCGDPGRVKQGGLCELEEQVGGGRGTGSLGAGIKTTGQAGPSGCGKRMDGGHLRREQEEVAGQQGSGKEELLGEGQWSHTASMPHKGRELTGKTWA